MGKIVVGLDLGIASVGYSVVLIGENNNVSLLERGSHLFKTLSNPKTINSPGGYGEGLRGEQRRARRTIRRRKQRRIDFIRLINDYSISGKNVKSKYSEIFNFDANEVKNIALPIYELAAKGLKEELNSKELFKVLYAKLSFRGVSYNLPNENLDLPLAIELLNIFKEVNKVRTTNARVNENNEVLKFSIKRNRRDIEEIIDNCSYLKNTKFKEDYFLIFDRVRDYSLGAGSVKSRTNGGIYKKEKDLNGNYIELKNMWESSIGKCLVFNDEYRALKCQALPEISNLLSQLNSMKYKKNNEIFVITTEQKKEIIMSVMRELRTPTPKRIEKILQLDKGLLFGYPTSKDRTKSNIEKCENLIRLFERKVLLLKDWESTLSDIEQTDIIFSKVLINFYNKDEIENANKNYLKSIEHVKKADKNKIINNYENFCCLNPVAKWNETNLRFEKIKGQDEKTLGTLESFQKNNISGTHSFSLKAIKNYITKNIDSQKTLSTFYRNQIDLFQISEYKFNKRSKYINNRLMDSVEFISPNIKNAMSETCKIFNRILNKYIYNGPKHVFDSLVIETTSDSKYALNGMENNKEIIKIQTKNENEKKEIVKRFPFIKDSTIEKILLLKEQDFIDLYDGKPIHEEEIIDNPDKFEIDHILPISRTQLNERTNKVITKTFNNQDKKNRTPIEWLSSKSNFNDLKDKWKTILEKENPIKLKHMLYENLTSKREKSFIARNLTETQYIMRRIKNGFLAWKKFINDNHTSFDVKSKISELEILTVSGSVTQRLRSEKYLNLDKKDRNLSAEHHSIDASICAVLGTIPEFRNTMKSFIRKIDGETGEIKWIYNDLKPQDIFSYFVISSAKWFDLSKIILNSPWILSYKHMTKLDKYKNIEDKLNVINNKDIVDLNWRIPKKISGEKVFGWIERDNNKYQKTRVNLNNLKENDIKFLDNIFSKTYEETNCLNPKNYFLILQKIWHKYYQSSKENPFLLYMEEHSRDDKEFKRVKQLNQIKLLDGKLNSQISRMTFIGDKASIGLDLSNKIAKNAYMEKLTTKCIFIVEDNKGNKKFLKEDWLNRGQKYCAQNQWKIIDIIEIDTIYNIENSLVRVTGCHVTDGRLQLSPVQGEKNIIQKPYSSFSQTSKKISNRIVLFN